MQKQAGDGLDDLMGDLDALLLGGGDIRAQTGATVNTQGGLPAPATAKVKAGSAVPQAAASRPPVSSKAELEDWLDL